MNIEKQPRDHWTDVLLFIMAGGLIGGFMYGAQWDIARDLSLTLFGAVFGYARGRK